MNRYLTGFVIISAVLVSGCAADRAVVEIRIVPPDVPATLRQPVEVPKREVEVLADVGLVLTDHVEALEVANGRITAIDCILTAAESGKSADCDTSSP